jgi:excisionase family DNA binding protein
MPDELLTSAEVARLLGVTAATVKRWADAGLIACARTPGAHRRFDATAVAAFARTQRAPPPHPAVAAPPFAEGWVDRLAAERDPIALQAQLLAERARLASWWRVAEVLGPVVHAIGQRWADGRLSVLEEHELSERLARTLARIAEAIPVAPGAPRVLLATAAGDDHTLGLALAELAIRERGWSTRWAGRLVPAAELAAAASRREADVLALSASVASAAPALEAEVALLAPACRAAGVGLVLGGAGPWPDPPPHGARLRTFGALGDYLGAEEERRGRAGEGSAS